MAEQDLIVNRLLPAEPVASLDDWINAEGGEGYARALDMAPEEVIDLVGKAGLRGRGGAGFPTAVKWRGTIETARENDSDLFIVANGAEGEPGTYKDRPLMLKNPYLFLEGLLIAMYATGAVHAFVGTKRKFKEPVKRLTRALEEMREAGWIGADRIDIVLGPDAYLFGEEKALLEVVEGRLPMPRNIAPFMNGLFAMGPGWVRTEQTGYRPNPTVVNNVESISHVARILAYGPEWFREMGTEASPGTMIFTVVGDVPTPGVYELPLGTPMRVLLEDIAGATDIKAVYSGVSNAVITPDMLDTPLTFDDMRSAGAGLGSGGYIVYDHSRNMVNVCATLEHFLAIESCGQCQACKIGNMDMDDIFQRIQRGQGTMTDLEALAKRSRYVTDANRCFLPVGAQVTVGSTIREFLDEFVATVESGKPTPADIPVPLIDHIDENTGEVTFHPRYHLKQPDWSYSDEDPGEERLRELAGNLPRTYAF